MRDFMVKCVERSLEGGGGLCEIPMRLPMNDCGMKTVACIWVDIWCMMDWIIGLCHKAAEMYFSRMSCSTSECIR